jgi:hypothetical protein
MKKIAIGALLLAASSTAFAEAPGGPDCGWGNMLFEGSTGLPTHILAGTTNGSVTGNNTFGMSSGTNGCSVNGNLTYGGKSIISFNNILDEFSEDVAQGNGEALNAVAVMFGVKKEDRSIFAEVTHKNFNTLFPSENVTGEEVFNALVGIMKDDARLAKYIV